MSASEIEQARRRFKLNNGALYAYIRSYEKAKAYEAGGDLASGASSGEAAANRLYVQAGRERNLLREIDAPTEVPEV